MRKQAENSNRCIAERMTVYTEKRITEKDCINSIKWIAEKKTVQTE